MVNVKKENAIKQNIISQAQALGSKPKTQKQKRGQSAPQSRKSSIGFAEPPMQAKLIVDPFNAMFFGAKCCDESMVPTSAYHARDSDSFSSDNTGQNCYGYTFTTYMGAHLIGPGATTNNGVVWAGGGQKASGKLASALQNYDLTRPIAGGLKLRASGNELTQNGTVHYACVAHNSRNGLVSDLPQTIADLQNHGTYGSFPVSRLSDKDFVIRHLPYDNTANQFHDVDFTPTLSGSDTGVTQSDEYTSGWGSIVVLFENFKNGATCEFEHIVHYEATVKNREGSVVTPTMATPYSPVLLAATKNMVAALPAGYVNDATGGWSSKVASLFQTGLKWAMGVAPHALELATMLL